MHWLPASVCLGVYGLTLYCATELIQADHWVFALVVLVFGFSVTYQRRTP